MNKNIRRILFWVPRILCILFIIFLSLFSLDVFGEGYGFWESILAFLIHNIPVFIAIIVLVIAWRWEWVGAVLFTAAAVFYIVMFWDDGDWIAYLMISGPLFLISILFLLNWLFRSQIHHREE